MDYCFRLALAAGFLALPLSLFAEEKGSPSGGDLRPKVPEMTLRQKLEKKVRENQKMKVAMQLAEQKRKETQSKLANGKENHPNDTPGKQQGEQDKRQSTGNGPKGHK